ncbi:hypothetical protein B0J13DRAFT_556682 [Dactylonectria estremocensis]|uniref:Uncharacterized protein n=1 Tax=Dactylonectria estremocensis TaxID=1079267 RepID=A0A9P9EQI1_9HYPO|nr:hypothetical protein B0J13DRAFT_556682 [Dactylonectria estremocensis]
MAQPIDIPVKRSRLQAATFEKSVFPADEGPYFGYIELFESGHVYRALSSGSGKYVEIGARCSLPTLAFIVEKDRFSRSITVEITSLGLKQAVSHAIRQPAASLTTLELDFNTVLKNYEALKAHLNDLRERYPYDDVTSEMQLLVEDLLLERALYDNMNMDLLRQRKVLSTAHLQDIHAQNVGTGLSDIEDCFSLGLIPDNDSEQHLEALNLRYAERARLGDYAGLRSLCEPIVRAGEIELEYNPSLLLEVLQSGHMDVFQYMLDLADRTKKTSFEVPDPQYSDITFEPLYVAISLGQLPAVRYFIEQHATFEGYVFDGPQESKDQIFTPLSAAAFWHQPDIARLLLRSGPIYYAGLQQASVLAQQHGSMDVLQVLTEGRVPSGPASFIHEIFPQSTSPQFQFSVSPQSLFYPVAPMGQSPPGLARSVSGITNALSGIDDSASFQPAFQSGSFTSTNTQRISTAQPPPIVISPDQYVSPIPVEPCDLANSAQTSNLTDGFAQFNQVPFTSIRHTRNHKARQQLGRNLTQRLEERCESLRTVCSSHPFSKAFSEMAKYFEHVQDVWKSGINCFREITRNKAPSSLVEVLWVLVVADALGCQIPYASNDLTLEFTNDLGRWKTLLQGSERTMFDEIVCAVWNVDTVPTLDLPESDPDELYRFQELIQNLISLEDTKHLKSGSSGSRLRAVQRQLKSQKKTMRRQRADRPPVQPIGSFQSIGSVIRELTRDTDSFHEDEIDLEDFIDLDAFGVAPVDSNPASCSESLEPHVEWKDVHPIVVLLFASVAFSIALTAVSTIQDPREEQEPKVLSRVAPGYGRSCAIVEGFLSFQSEDKLYDSGIDVRSAGEEWASPYIQEMKKASQRNCRLRSLNPVGTPSASLTVPTSMSSPSGSSFMSTDFSSPDTARSTKRRVKCLSCQKTFSSVSNRNKHMREGCAKIERKGYVCRNESCTKVLTTKWYRKTHEQTRCRFR